MLPSEKLVYNIVRAENAFKDTEWRSCCSGEMSSSTASQGRGRSQAPKLPSNHLAYQIRQEELRFKNPCNKRACHRLNVLTREYPELPLSEKRYKVRMPSHVLRDNIRIAEHNFSYPIASPYPIYDITSPYATRLLLAMDDRKESFSQPNQQQHQQQQKQYAKNINYNFQLGHDDACDLLEGQESNLTKLLSNYNN